MTNLTEDSLQKAIEDVHKYQEETGKKISVSATKMLMRPIDIYLQGRKDMQNEIIDKLGSYEANKCAQIAASIPVDPKDAE